MSDVRCPICDAEAGEPCYDSAGELPYKGKHHGRFEAEREAEVARRLAVRDEAHHEREITRINREISRLIANRTDHERALQELRDA